MAIFAEVRDGTVCGVIDTERMTSYKDEHLRRLSGFVECGADVRVGWIYDGSGFSAPPEPTLEELKAAKREEIAAARHAAEIGGCEAGGMQILTDRESQAMITGAALAAVVDKTYSCRWKTPAGFVELNGEAVIAAASAVRAHVQACFDREAVLIERLEAAETAEEAAAVVW